MGTLIVGTGSVGATQPSGLVAFNTETGAQLWRTTLTYDQSLYTHPSSGVFVGTSFYVLQTILGSINPVPPTASELVKRINPNDGSLISSFAFHPYDASNRRVHVGTGGIQILPFPIAGFLVAADMAAFGIPASLKFPVFRLSSSTGEVMTTYYVDAHPTFVGASAPADFIEAAAMAVDDQGILYYGRGTSGVWQVKRFDLVNNTQLADLFNDGAVVTKHPVTGTTQNIQNVEMLKNGDVLVTGASTIKRFDRSTGVQIARLDLTSPTVANSQNIEPQSHTHPIGQFLWTEGGRNSAGALTNSELWKVPTALTGIPSAVFATITPKFTDTFGTEHVVAFMVSTQLDLPLRQRQRDDCMEPGSARPCSLCFTLNDFSYVCIPPFWLRLTASVTFGGRVGPRNSYN